MHRKTHGGQQVHIGNVNDNDMVCSGNLRSDREYTSNTYSVGYKHKALIIL